MSATACSEMVLWNVIAQADIKKAGSHNDSGGQECPPRTSSGQECPPYADDRDLWFYRDRTVALLKRYMRMAVQTGRLPSLLGRECFRARVTRYTMASFEDMVIFVHDMEMALQRLDDYQQQLIALNVLEEYSQWEIARLMGCTKRWIEWQVAEALDALSVILLHSGLLRGVSRESVRKVVKREERTNRL